MARIQFNVTQLLLLTTLVAVVAAILNWFNLPPAFALVVWAFTICWGFLLVIRGPAAAREYHEIRRRRQEIHERRTEMILEARARLEKLRANKARLTDAPHDSPDRLN